MTRFGCATAAHGAASERRAALRMLRDCDPAQRGAGHRRAGGAADGRQRIIHVEAEPEFNEHGHGVGYTGIVQDVTDRRIAEDRIRHLANFDALTGLPNRRQLIWRTERALEHARRLAHLRVAADRPGPLQDHQRHARPCRRRRVADGGGARLRGCVRHSDQVMEGTLEAAGSRAHRSLEAVGRLGGDEFVALLPEVGDEATPSGWPIACSR
jgi:predicted signal transduction protein with EAL and GGDEF domain